MVDLILAFSIGASFFAGFKTGNCFKTFGEVWKNMVSRLKS